MAPQPYTKEDLRRGEELVKELHGIKGYDAWAEHIAKALRQATEAGANNMLNGNY